MDRFNYVNRRKRSRDPLERRMDQLFQTGRQFVDGVAGNRPGIRRKDNVGISTRESLENAGRWMGDKLDWFFEEDDNWLDSNKNEANSEVPISNIKRPLQAISLRVTKAIAPSSQQDPMEIAEDEWPDESTYRINRWQRIKSNDNGINSANDLSRQSTGVKRSLPKSSRRRN